MAGFLVSTSTGGVDRLPATFSYSQARAAGLSDRRLYALRDAGTIEQIGQGLFRRADQTSDADPDLLEIAYRAPRATLCLTSALARHDLSDAIPHRIDVALPRGSYGERCYRGERCAKGCALNHLLAVRV